MGKIMCKCGEVMSDVVLPNDYLNYLVSSDVVWEVPESLEKEFHEDKLDELWECPSCKGLTRFPGDSAHATCYYRREDY